MMRSLLFWGLLPFVIPQALLLRRTAPRFAGAAGPKEGAVGSGRRVNLIAIGDSIIAGVGAENLADALVGRTAAALAGALDCRVSWLARGSIGADSRKVLGELLPELPDTPAAFIILSVGVNDATGLATVRRLTRNLDELLSKLSRHSPEAVIAVAGIPPLRGFPLLPQPMRALFGMRGETFDAAIRRVVSGHRRVVHVPLDFDPTPDRFSADGFHPSEESYRDFGRLMADGIIAAYDTGPSPARVTHQSTASAS
jgi:lysophospholipase L1-like esterase